MRRPPSVSTIGLVVLASVLVTSIHFTDNYVSFDTYPQPGWITETVVLVSWPLFTVFGVAGYLLYRRGSFAAAHTCLLIYSYTGISSLGHLLSGSPGELTTRGLVSVLVDGVAGSAVLAVTIWSALAIGFAPDRSSRAAG